MAFFWVFLAYAMVLEHTANKLILKKRKKKSKEGLIFIEQDKVFLDNFKNYQFFAKIGLGEPSQWLDVVLDTGSGNFFINSKYCVSDFCEDRKAFDRESSITYEGTGEIISAKYGSGRVEGVVGQDTLVISGIKIYNQTFAEITKEEGSDFRDAEFSGILGLAFGGLAYGTNVTVLERIIIDQLLDWNVLGFYFNLDPEQDSEVTIGSVDSARFIGVMHWVPLTENPFYWSVKMTDIRFGSKSTGLCKPYCLVAFDTGSSLITGPSSDVFSLYDKLENACDYLNMPDLIFLIDEEELALPATSYMVSISGGQESLPLVHDDLHPFFRQKLRHRPASWSNLDFRHIIHAFLLRGFR